MDDISIIKPIELENYAKEISSHDFFELFPNSKFSFDQNKYQYYLYFGDIEAQKYLQDYMTFVSRMYPNQKFDKDFYFVVFDEFCRYLEMENVYFFYKTKVGAFYLNKAVDTSAYLIREGYLKDNLIPLALSTKYFYPFFTYLEKKITGSAMHENFVIEKLEREDLMYMQEIYMGRVKLENAPFFLDEKNKSYKFARAFVVSNILPMATNERAYLLGTKDSVCGIAIASAIKNNTLNLSIMTDIDYMDSDFSNFLEILKTKYSGLCEKIIVKNPNRNIASSNLNTACILSHFKVDYDNFLTVDGYTQYDHYFKFSDEEQLITNTHLSPPLISNYNKQKN